MQFDHNAVCTTIIEPQWSAQRLRQNKLKFQKEIDGQTKVVLERCMATCGRTAGTRAKMRSRARKQASAREARGYYKQFAEAKHLEYKSWVDNRGFWSYQHEEGKVEKWCDRDDGVLTIKTDKQGNFLRAKDRRVLRGFHDKQKEYQPTESPASTRPEFQKSCHMAARTGWDIFSSWSQSSFSSRTILCDVNRDVVCQLPPEAGHPP